MDNEFNKKEAPTKTNPEYLYKFRSLDGLEFVLDIVLYERLYCSLYTNLNDPFEGMFISIVNSFRSMRPGPPRPPHAIPVKEKKYKSIDDLPIDLSNTRICSLSSDCNDVRLWAHYADSQRGIAIQIKFSDSDSKLHEVYYSETFPEFEHRNFNTLNINDILTRKTKHWQYESEYRIINHEEFYSINDKISAIFLGPRIEDKRKELILKIVSGNIPVYSTRINKEKIQIEKDQRIN
jgi:hypothetical protein